LELEPTEKPTDPEAIFPKPLKKLLARDSFVAPLLAVLSSSAACAGNAKTNTIKNRKAK